jgi:hypothetical protein
MKGRIYLCYNCPDARQVPGRSFTAEKPVCPQCGLDGTDPRFASLIVQCRVIHFETPHPIAVGRGSGKLACEAKYSGVMASGHPDVVNCPACRATVAWDLAKTQAESSVDDGELPDLELQGDLKGGQYVKAG